MARNTRNKTYLAAFCEHSLAARLDDFADTRGFSRSEAMRLLIHDGLARQGWPKPPAGSVSASLDIDRTLPADPLVEP